MESRKPLPSIPRIIITAALIAVAILITHTATENSVRAQERETIDTRYQEQEAAIQGLTMALEDMRKQNTELLQIISELQSQVEELQFKINPDIPLSAELQEFTYFTAMQYGVPYEEVLVMMERESGFNIDAVNVNTNRTMDKGICQINQVALPFLYERGIDPYASPEDNITAACVLYAYYRYELGCTPLEAWAAYGSGYSGMRAGRGIVAARELIEDSYNL